MGLCWLLRAFEDLGERMAAAERLDGWAVLGLGRFLVLRGCVGSGVFSLSSSAEIWSLGLLVPRWRGVGSACLDGEGAMDLDGLGCCLGASAGRVGFLSADSEVCSMLSRYFWYSSPIFAFRIAVGMRLTRNSILARKLWA